MFDTRFYEEIDSTNAEAKRLVQSGTITRPTIIYADRQTNGQGSRGRTWSSNKSGNLLATYVLPIDEGWPDKNYLALYPVSVAVYAFIKHTIKNDADIKIKWPNDLLLEGQKLGGMLHEIADYHGQKFFIAGIGLNVAWHPEVTDNFPATSLITHEQNLPDILDMVETLGIYIWDEIINWQVCRFEEYKINILPILYKLGQEILIHPRRQRDHAIKGIFKDIDDNGCLILETATSIRIISTGDIFPELKSVGNASS